MRLLVANRGEIAVRILRAAAGLGIPTLAVYSEDDAGALHVRRADAAHALRGSGAAAYLDAEQIVAAAKQHGCDLLHPGYGFLSEQAHFASRCAAAGIRFVGPDAEALAIFGDKPRARALAARCGVPVLRGTGPADEDEARRFLGSLGPGAAALIKAVAGGGGRGMRVVRSPAEIDEAFARCRAEARQAFGSDALYAEEFLAHARHVEVQVLGDGSGGLSHLFERECSIQRRHQKLIEIAPCPALPGPLRERLLADALALARAAAYRSAGTFEFLVGSAAHGGDPRHAFIEANARLQVEHTVTEEVLDVDLVQAQLRIALGATLAELGLEQADVPQPRGFAIQVRINAETLQADGSVWPAGGTLSVFEPPSGRGVRVDSAAHAGYRPNPGFDSLLAKLIGHSPSPQLAAAIATTSRALAEFQIAGLATNLPLLQAILQHPEFAAGRAHTRFVEEHLAELAAASASPSDPTRAHDGDRQPLRAGARLDAVDPLAVLEYGRSAAGAAAPRAAAAPAPAQPELAGPPGTIALRAPLLGTIAAIEVREGDLLAPGQLLLVLSAMKMEHEIRAESGGVVRLVAGALGDTVVQGAPLLWIEARDVERTQVELQSAADLEHVRPDLAELQRRRALTRDDARAGRLAETRARGRRTARENIEDLCDPQSFLQYGSLGVGQMLQGSVDELLEYAPSDGMVMGLGQVNGELFGESRARCVVLSYDYSVLAGTQGGMNHRMIDRIFETAEKLRAPVVLFAEGGGGRAGGGTRARGAAPRGGPGPITGGGALGTPSWNKLSQLSALVPLVGIASGRCFAGNAALLGCCDAIIATPDASIGMGGPAMIEGGGLGVYRPEEVGPLPVQVASGVVDVAVADEAAAVRAARQYLSYFQGPLARWECADPRALRGLIPENRLRVYDIRTLIETLCDTSSVLELRRGFGMSMVTALARIEGRPLGIVANDPQHLSGAIDSPAADKAARFLQLCDAFDLPVLFLCDTPGIMVGPEVEKTGLVRHANRLFVIGASMTVPTFSIVLRKAYGLGAQTMGGGNHRLPIFTVSWPTGEFGGMGLEGQVKLGRRRELEEIADPAARRERYERMVAQAYERGRALNAAHVFEVDDVIDPADSRRWIAAGLRCAPPPEARSGKKRPCIDPW